MLHIARPARWEAAQVAGVYSLPSGVVHCCFDSQLRLVVDAHFHDHGDWLVQLRRDRRWGAYCASKAAAAMLQQCLRAEVEPLGIAVGIGRPGAVDTHLLRVARDADERVFPDATEIRQLYEQGGVASPEEAADFLAHLLLDLPAAEFAAREWDRRTDGTRR